MEELFYCHIQRQGTGVSREHKCGIVHIKKIFMRKRADMMTIFCRYDSQTSGALIILSQVNFWI